MIKVLHLSSPKSWRGGEQQIAYLAEEHQRKNLTKPIILTSKNSKLSSWCSYNNIEYYTVNNLGLNFKSASKINTIIKEKKIDIIHCHDSKAHNAAIINAVLYKSNIPIILSRRVDFPVSDNIFSKYKYNHRNIKKIICVSDTIKTITANSIKDKSKLTTVHSGVDTNKFRDCDKQLLKREFHLKDEIIIGNTSAIAPHKDYPTFINVAEEILKKKSNVKFFIIGDGPEKQNIESIIKEKGLETDIILTGFRKDIADVLSSLDIFLITSETEGLGTSIIDAFAAGIPVVATNAGGIPELVEHNKTGYLAKIKDTESIAEGILKIIDNKKFRDNIIAGAKLKLKGFTKENTALETYEVYKEVIKD